MILRRTESASIVLKLSGRVGGESEVNNRFWRGGEQDFT